VTFTTANTTTNTTTTNTTNTTNTTTNATNTTNANTTTTNTTTNTTSTNTTNTTVPVVVVNTAPTLAGNLQLAISQVASGTVPSNYAVTNGGYYQITQGFYNSGTQYLFQFAEVGTAYTLNVQIALISYSPTCVTD